MDGLNAVVLNTLLMANPLGNGKKSNGYLD